MWDTTTTMIRILPLTFITLVVLTACQAVPRPDIGDAVSRPASEQEPTLPDGQRYLVLGKQSEVRIVVFPAGALARLGHPHVIGGAVIDGEVVVAEEFGESGLLLTIAVDDLEVDRPDWRQDEGFDPDMSDSAIRDTRENMLSAEQLDVANHPQILIESLQITGPPWQPDIEVRITLAGTARDLTVPVALNIDNHNLTATGRFMILQSDFGIEPFSAAGGRLQVADEVLIRFRINAMAQ